MAIAARFLIGHRNAPVAHAFPSATTWSMSTSVPSPWTKWMAAAGVRIREVARVDDAVVGSRLEHTWVRSRASTSLRVSQPLRSASSHAGPNWSRS